MKLPRTTFPLALVPEILTPLALLPEMRLHAPVQGPPGVVPAVPPMMLPVAGLLGDKMVIPAAFASVRLPETSVPMKLP